jgi:hypothetical protein
MSRAIEYRKTLESALEFLAKWVAYIAAAATAVGTLWAALTWGQRGPLAYLGAHAQSAWNVAATAGLVVLWIWVLRLRNRLTNGFSDNFVGDPRQRWDFGGPWHVDNRCLVVTGSDEGGVTKKGALWENYTLTFEARIVSRCLGVIVRAQDLDNYYMLQINVNRIQPHRRVAVPTLRPPSGPAESSDSVGHGQSVTYATGWQVFENQAVDLPRPLEGWFRVRVRVNGESLELAINGDVLWQQEAFLKIPTGKIGFRNFDSEQAFVRKVRVRLDA